VGPEIPERGLKKRQRCQSSEQIWNFYSAVQNISCHYWWPWRKPCYITTIRRQSNNQWSGDIAAHPAPPKKLRVQKSAGKILASIFWDQDGIFLSSFQTAKPSTRSITHLYWCTWRTFWRKNAAEKSPRWSCSCMTMPRLTGHLEPQRNWPTWASNVSITHPILRIWPRRTTTCSLDFKNNWKVVIFIRRGGHCCRGHLVGQTIFWIFLSGLQKLEQRTKKCIELRGEYVSSLVGVRTCQHPIVLHITLFSRQCHCSYSHYICALLPTVHCSTIYTINTKPHSCWTCHYAVTVLQYVQCHFLAKCTGKILESCQRFITDRLATVTVDSVASPRIV